MKAVNLLPSDVRGAAAKPATPSTSPTPAPRGGVGPFVVLGILAFAVVAVAGYVLTTNTIKDRKAELARVEADHAATLRQATALKPYADFAAMATARVSTVQALAGSRFDWEQALRDMSRALPADTHLIKLEGTLGGATGGSSSSIRSASPAPAIQLQGCTGSQSDVARMMSRLRNVRGVTRVSLASSDKEASAGTAQAAPSITGEQPAQLCPKGDPPTFDVVVFFERSAAVAAGSTPTTATAAPTATPAPGATPVPTPGAAAGSAQPATGSTGTTTPASATQGATTP
jgi:Tfp pilus assembly protein PilN